MKAKVLAGYAAIWLWSTHAFAQQCPEGRSAVTVAYGEYVGAPHVTFTPSNDGTLTATDAETGATLWAFGTEEAGAPAATTPNKRINRMTDVRVLRFDANHDGTIDISSGDKVWLYFGTRRTGILYYALDVTDRSMPRLLWKIGTDALEGAGEAWSTPTIARVRVSGAAQNGEHFVLILGGGYAEAPSTGGNRLFMVDAATGKVLWYAGGPGATKPPDLSLAQMRYPVPARIAAVDTDGDQFADRLYTVDVVGQVWRFDIWNGRARSALVTGGVLADLQSTGVVRRFFNAPDVALIQHRGADAYYNLALGSGDYADLDTPPSHDRFYSIKDRQPFSHITQSGYDSATPILEADLTDITAASDDFRLPAEASGWKLDLNERVLAESLTANGVILFTTYQPGSDGGGGVDGSECAVGGTGRVYAVRTDSGTAALDLNNDKKVTFTDRSMRLTKAGIPGEPTLQLAGDTPTLGTPTGGSTEPGDGAPETPVRCRVGAEVLSKCVPLNAVIRTFWQLRSVE